MSPKSTVRYNMAGKQTGTPRTSTGCSYTPRPTAAPLFRSSSVGQFATRRNSSWITSRSRSRDCTPMQASRDGNSKTASDHSREDAGRFRVADSSRQDGTFSSITDRSREVASSSSAQQLTCETNSALQSCMMDLQKSILYDQTLRAHAEPVYRHNPASRHHKPKPSSAYLHDQTLETRMRCNIDMLRICKDLARLQRQVGQLK